MRHEVSYFITFYIINVSYKFYYHMAILFCQACAGIPPEQGKEPPMENILFEHNQRAYEAAVEMMEAKKASAVFPHRNISLPHRKKNGGRQVGKRLKISNSLPMQS